MEESTRSPSSLKHHFDRGRNRGIMIFAFSGLVYPSNLDYGKERGGLKSESSIYKHR